jgi:hypothetical protein
MDSIVLHTVQLLQHCRMLQSLMRLAEESVSFYNFVDCRKLSNAFSNIVIAYGIQ